MMVKDCEVSLMDMEAYQSLWYNLGFSLYIILCCLHDAQSQFQRLK